MGDIADEIGFYADAVADFRRARVRAKLEQLQAWLSGDSADLLDYEQVRKSVHAFGQVSRGVQDIPIASIVGSVGRYTDFTRMFLPRQDGDANRWARVKVAMNDSLGLPPIEVYKIDQVYFVLDGNHRISVARQMGATHIQAYVTEVMTDVPLTPDIEPDELILKAELADFLSNTSIHTIRPKADLSVSVPGQYQKLEEHIAVHRYYMGLEQKKDISYQQAVAHWYDAVYMPVIKVIRELGVMAHFPERTETDLYLWLMEYRAQLVDTIDIDVPLAPVAQELVRRYSPKPSYRLDRVGKRLLDAVIPKALRDGPPPGLWQERTRARLQETLFANILFALDGSERGWRALTWVLELAQSEGAEVYGLHVTQPKAKVSEHHDQLVAAEFERRLKQKGIKGTVSTLEGKTASLILDRARWMDLVALSLTHPYDHDPVSRLESGLRAIIRRCPTPVLAIPDRDFRLQRLLLAYDDSPKAREALFVATYLTGTCQTCLDVVTATTSLHLADDVLAYARAYLDEHKVTATYFREEEPAGEAILRVAAERGADMVIMGGYGLSPIAEIALGSAVDAVLSARQLPVLICQ